jgi:hypothetical protein
LPFAQTLFGFIGEEDKRLRPVTVGCLAGCPYSTSPMLFTLKISHAGKVTGRATVR